MEAPARVRRLVDVGFGVALSSTAFFGRPRPRLGGTMAGAGVNSSSSSSLICGAGLSSSSDSSTTGAFLRVAAARVDFRGDRDDMFAAAAGLDDRPNSESCMCFPETCATVLVNKCAQTRLLTNAPPRR